MSSRIRFQSGPKAPAPPKPRTIGLLYSTTNNVGLAIITTLDHCHPGRFQYVHLHGQSPAALEPCDAIIGNFECIRSAHPDELIAAAWESRKKRRLIHAYDPRSSSPLEGITNVPWDNVHDLLTGVVDSLTHYLELSRSWTIPTADLVRRVFRNKIQPMVRQMT